MKHRNLMLLSLLASVPAVSHSMIDTILITPTRTPQTGNNSSATVYSLNREDINKSGAKTTSELLRGIPGIQIDDLFGNGTETSISVRGFLRDSQCEYAGAGQWTPFKSQRYCRARFTSYFSLKTSNALKF